MNIRRVLRSLRWYRLSKVLLIMTDIFEKVKIFVIFKISNVIITSIRTRELELPGVISSSYWRHFSCRTRYIKKILFQTTGKRLIIYKPG